MDKLKVLVTGGTGYVAAYIMKELLMQGYTVRTTLRKMNRKVEIENNLIELGCREYLDNLEYVKADLSLETGWSEAMSKIDYVMHVASPFPLTMPKDENDLIIPAKEGTLRILKLAKENKVKRVVMTSAYGAAGMGYGKEYNDYLFTEKDWSNLAPEGHLNAYYKSKTIAEQAALSYAKEQAIDLVTLLPVAILGPVLAGKVTGSNALIEMLLDGKMPVYFNMEMPLVDVRDLAHAHILAMTTSDIAGERFIITASYSKSLKEIGAILKQQLPNEVKKVPKHVLPDTVVRLLGKVVPLLRGVVPDLGVKRKMSAEKAQKYLKWQTQYSVEVMIKEAAQSIIKKNMHKNK